MKTGLRQDLAVIMARGASRRMGRPKGLCRLSGLAQSFLPTLVAVYRQLEMPILIVTNRQDEAAYRAAVTADADVAWCAADGAGDTAETARLAWRIRPDASHYWLQPVDMPLLQPATLAILQKATCTAPGRIVRPVCEGRPGHPVVIPEPVLRTLLPQPGEDANAAPGPLRDLIDAAVADERLAPPLTVAVADTGTVTDYDEPHELR